MVVAELLNIMLTTILFYDMYNDPRVYKHACLDIEFTNTTNMCVKEYKNMECVDIDNLSGYNYYCEDFGNETKLTEYCSDLYIGCRPSTEYKMLDVDKGDTDKYNQIICCSNELLREKYEPSDIDKILHVLSQGISPEDKKGETLTEL